MSFSSKHPGIVDIHSHIIPCVDDGSQSFLESETMLKIASKSGIKSIIATPHYKKGKKNATTKQILDGVRLLNTRAKENEIPITVYPGNEIMYFDDLPLALECGDVLSLNHSKYVLIEFLPEVDFVRIRNAVYSLVTIGYIPIIAHAERYTTFRNNIENIKEIKKMGAKVQINFVSAISGGKEEKLCKKWMDEAIVNFLASDMHVAKRFDKRGPSVKNAAKYLYSIYKSEYMDRIVFENGTKVIKSGKRQK